ncbi:dihydrolipoamide acetyltransferase family protein [Mycobacterium sp. 852002-10029_SCH5224772]|uniref:dihydrolipoamide acetyltransferase family protein n=1 Tax=Mycobacterium sp. 852002-10029_SCH5224772 TaxID=1834083 RepID=UPI0007FC5F19|nr:dihydrolipoamide acetyltransferase family protein [Mycobacterium sp. 852002-10029_SCH5224772]OBF05271.1 branched-chain alpha-keto acid dehydrogenase subunit E2 [Mycobacterium sp. 852002-10029_SCH5224772]
MTDRTFVLPDLGEGLAEAVIADWRVRVGDTVTVDQVVVEVETAKVAVEVPVPFAGKVIELHGDVGSTLAVGAPLITVISADEPEATEPGAGAGSGNVLVGYGTREAGSRRRRHRTPVPQPIAPAAATTKVISPVVRKVARDTGVDLTVLPAPGPGGVITRADVEHALTQTATSMQDEQRTPITGMRKAIAEKLSISRREIPDATTWVDVDATGLLDARRSVQEVAGRKVSLLALLARFTVAALRQFPDLNSSVDTARSEFVRYRHVNLGIAAQTPRGLVVPVIKNVDTLDVLALSDVLTETTTLARNDKLPPARLTGGTFTLNNYGVFGVDGSTPIINHPEAAILGIGRIIDRPWAVDGALTVRKITQVSLSFDHRVCDGATAGGFLRLFGDFIENPIAALARL